jgi:hypothetical protein
MKRLLIQKIKIQHGLCFYCHKEFDDFSGVVPEHVEPKGSGGARHDDHPNNIVASCVPCNQEKGSKRIV